MLHTIAVRQLLFSSRFKGKNRLANGVYTFNVPKTSSMVLRSHTHTPYCNLQKRLLALPNFGKKKCSNLEGNRSLVCTHLLVHSLGARLSVCMWRTICGRLEKNNASCASVLSPGGLVLRYAPRTRHSDDVQRRV